MQYDELLKILNSRWKCDRKDCPVEVMFINAFSRYLLRQETHNECEVEVSTQTLWSPLKELKTHI